MKYVIDSSVAFKWAVMEIDSDKALRLLTDYQNTVHELLAPDLFGNEIANALLWDVATESQYRVVRVFP